TCCTRQLGPRPERCEDAEVSLPRGGRPDSAYLCLAGSAAGLDFHVAEQQHHWVEPDGPARVVLALRNATPGAVLAAVRVSSDAPCGNVFFTATWCTFLPGGSFCADVRALTFVPRSGGGQVQIDSIQTGEHVADSPTSFTRVRAVASRRGTWQPAFRVVDKATGEERILTGSHRFPSGVSLAALPQEASELAGYHVSPHAAGCLHAVSLATDSGRFGIGGFPAHHVEGPEPRSPSAKMFVMALTLCLGAGWACWCLKPAPLRVPSAAAQARARTESSRLSWRYKGHAHRGDFVVGPSWRGVVGDVFVTRHGHQFIRVGTTWHRTDAVRALVPWWVVLGALGILAVCVCPLL
ncbi:MAG: hypothetical protein D6773_01150, partial [Alphaproteobacteria bacterium]